MYQQACLQPSQGFGASRLSYDAEVKMSSDCAAKGASGAWLMFIVPLADENLAALRSADVEYVLLERCGHFWHECPDQFYPRVRAFLGLA